MVCLCYPFQTARSHAYGLVFQNMVMLIHNSEFSIQRLSDDFEKKSCFAFFFLIVQSQTSCENIFTDKQKPWLMFHPSLV